MSVQYFSSFHSIPFQSIPFHSNPFGLHTFPLQVASGNYLKFKVHDLHAEFASLDSVCQICFWKSKQNVKG